MFRPILTLNMEASGAERSLMAKASRLYYLEEKGQAEIARILGISRPGVSRLLSRARREGVVEIRVNGAGGAADWPALARQIGLLELVVAGSDSTDSDSARNAVGGKAAEWFEAHVRPNELVGLTAGTTLAAFVRHVHHGLGLALRIVPLVGALWDTSEDFDGSFLCHELRRRAGGTHLVLSAPAVVGTAALAQSLRTEPRVRRVIDLYPSLRHAFFGVGNADESHPIVTATFGIPAAGRRPRNVLPKAAVASVGCLFFDSDGRPCQTRLDRRTIGASHGALKSVPMRIGMASGIEKLDAVLAVARGKVANVLVVDEPLAQGLKRRLQDP